MFSFQLRRGIPNSRALLGERLIRQFSTHINSKLEGKVALITGGASGIGEETAIRFINNGAKVVIADIQHQLGHHTAKKLGPNASFVPCDVSNETEISNAVDYTVSKHGQLDIMYNNAGAPTHSTSIVDMDLAVFDQVMALNVRAVMAGIKHASRVMIPRRTGSILCMASVGGMMGGVAPHAYAVSKCAVIGIVKFLAAELCKHGIRINCISNTAVLTPSLMDYMVRLFPGVDAEELTRMVRNSGELEGAYCDTGDIANAAVYLVSDDAKYVSGHNLVVDGGFTTMKTMVFPQPYQVD